jgi:CheY-like chemotaxis protein
MVLPEAPAFRCLVVSENAMHRLTLEQYVNLTENLQLVASLCDGVEAYDYLHQGADVDLVIIDLNAAGMQADELRPATQPGRPQWLLIEQMGSIPAFTCQSAHRRSAQPLCFSRFGKLIGQALASWQLAA